jgi:hypothetical protein
MKRVTEIKLDVIGFSSGNYLITVEHTFSWFWIFSPIVISINTYSGESTVFRDINTGEMPGTLMQSYLSSVLWKHRYAVENRRA